MVLSEEDTVLGKLIPNVLSPAYWKKTWQELQLVWQLTRDPRVPIYLKLLPAVVVVYLLLPFDLIPGFIPIIGQLDDLGLLLLGLQLFIRVAPSDLVDVYRNRMDLDRIET